jgi:hypothetical protein
MALSKQSPTNPIERCTPAARQARAKSSTRTIGDVRGLATYSPIWIRQHRLYDLFELETYAPKR